VVPLGMQRGAWRRGWWWRAFKQGAFRGWVSGGAVLRDRPRLRGGRFGLVGLFWRVLPRLLWRLYPAYNVTALLSDNIRDHVTCYCQDGLLGRIAQARSPAHHPPRHGPGLCRDPRPPPPGPPPMPRIRHDQHRISCPFIRGGGRQRQLIGQHANLGMREAKGRRSDAPAGSIV